MPENLNRKLKLRKDSTPMSSFVLLLMKREISISTIWLWGVVLLIAVVVISLLAQPIADDFWNIPWVQHTTLPKYIYDFYTTENGRFTGIAVMGVFIKLLGGSLAVKLEPVFFTIALSAATSWLAWQLLSTVKYRLQKSITIGIIFTATTLLVSPSIFDTLGWFSASSFYLVGQFTMALAVAYYLFLFKADRIRKKHLLLIFVLVFLGQGLSEPIVALVCLAASIALIYGFVKHRARMLNCVVWIASIAGASMIYFAPGERTRAGILHATPALHSMLINSLQDFELLWHTVYSWRIVLILIAGLIVSFFIPRINNRSKRLKLALAGLALCVIPLYITSALTRYANVMTDGFEPYRTFGVPLLFVVAGIILLIVSLVHSLPKSVLEYKATALYIFFIAGFVVAFLPIMTVVRAESLRASLMSYRASSISRQVSKGDKIITIIPSPILVKSQAIDFSYDTDYGLDSNRKSWIVGSIKAYYHISNYRIRVVPDAPPGYCLPKSDGYIWPGSKCVVL